MEKLEASLVFVDVLMPGFNGPQLIKEMGDDHGSKVVLMSAYSGEYNLETAKSIGADMFVPKPFDDIYAVFETAERLSQYQLYQSPENLKKK